MNRQLHGSEVLWSDPEWDRPPVRPTAWWPAQPSQPSRSPLPAPRSHFGRGLVIGAILGALCWTAIVLGAWALLRWGQQFN